MLKLTTTKKPFLQISPIAKENTDTPTNASGDEDLENQHISWGNHLLLAKAEDTDTPSSGDEDTETPGFKAIIGECEIANATRWTG